LIAPFAAIEKPRAYAIADIAFSHYGHCRLRAIDIAIIDADIIDTLPLAIAIDITLLPLYAISHIT